MDTNITCRRCGKVFTFSDSEQQFYQQKGFSLPTHCKECRAIRHSQNLSVCSKCGKKLENPAEIFCGECVETVCVETMFEIRAIKESLDETRNNLSERESEITQIRDAMKTNIEALELEKSQMASEISTKLNMVESEKQNLSKLLEQQKQITKELEDKLNNTQLELEKELKYRAKLDSIEPTLSSVGSTLAVILHTQELINNTLTRLANLEADKKQSSNLVEILKKIFGMGRKSASPIS